MDEGTPLTTAMYAASGGAALLAALLLLLRRPAAPAYLAGAGCFVFALLRCIGNVDLSLFGPLPVWRLELSNVSLAAMLPCLWLYVRDLTLDEQRSFRGADAWHFAPAAFTLSIALAAAVVVPGRLDTPPIWLNLFLLAAKLTLLGSATFYILRIAVRLLQIPHRLRLVFSSTTGRELIWLRGLLSIALLNWALTLLNNLGVWGGSHVLFSALAFIQIVLMGIWSVNQVPIFQIDATSGLRSELPAAESQTGNSEKYSRSLLAEDRLDRIAAKIDSAFRDKRLYLDPALSLKTLSTTTGITENHLSQTFTRRLAKSFFDYVNHWRVDEAKRLLAESTSTVSSICYECGFNSRSAFYNAFNAETGQTPAAFRKALAAERRVSS